MTGEVDSGKSTLIGRFLYETGSLSQGVIEEIENVCQRLGRDFEFAYLLDSFEEERKNQLTIDTTQAFCNAKRGKGFIFIDVPGHQELLKNMLCGSSYADIAIVVVDVQKSIEQQTERHVLVLKFLGIDQIILALNKMDLAEFNEDTFNKVKEDTRALFEKIDIQAKYFIPVSAKQGDNLCRKSEKMSWYKGLSLLEALNIRPARNRNGSFRFPIQDIYKLNGEDAAVGEIISGKIKRDEKVNVLPLNKECRIKAIRAFHKNRLSAKAPESVGLVLEDMENIKRGIVLCKEGLPQIKNEFLTKIFCLYPLKRGDKPKFRCATQEVSCEIKEINTLWDMVSEAVIFTAYPVAVEKFAGFNSLGRFVLKNDREICAIGIIC